MLRQRRRPRVDPSDSPKTPVVQTSARRPFSFVTTQNIREFNQLKYRGNNLYADFILSLLHNVK